jgi:hypothetical protein
MQLDSSLKTSECASTSEKSSHSEADLQRSATKNLIRSLSLKLQIASPDKSGFAMTIFFVITTKRSAWRNLFFYLNSYEISRLHFVPLEMTIYFSKTPLLCYACLMECSYAAGFADSTRAELAELLPLKGEQKSGHSVEFSELVRRRI